MRNWAQTQESTLIPACESCCTAFGIPMRSHISLVVYTTIICLFCKNINLDKCHNRYDGYNASCKNLKSNLIIDWWCKDFDIYWQTVVARIFRQNQLEIRFFKRWNKQIFRQEIRQFEIFKEICRLMKHPVDSYFHKEN